MPASLVYIKFIFEPHNRPWSLHLGSTLSKREIWKEHSIVMEDNKH